MRRLGVLTVLLLVARPMTAWAQEPPATPEHAASVPAGDTQTTDGAGDQSGFALPSNERFRIRFALMAGYGHDDAQAELGFEKQGRLGYAIVELFGSLNDRVSYRLSVNPVNEGDPRPACGHTDFFYPNEPGFLASAGPTVVCEEDGNRRVDMYKFIALDAMNQQGPIREAFIAFRLVEGLDLRFGRFVLPMGFGLEEMGSLTAKDATRIQRINAESNFGAMFTWRPARSRPLLSIHAAAFLGDGNRNRDYDYFYFERSDLDSNSALTALASATLAPIRTIEARVAVKRGFTGSKVEVLPSYWASKRHDDAIILSASYWPVGVARVFGEYARYTWGPTNTSAEMLGYEQTRIVKSGYYGGAEVSVPIRTARVGMTVTREELSRDDSLVKYMVENGLPYAVLGRTDRGSVFRFFVDVSGVTIGFYRNIDSTPFPWLSGIAPIQGPRAFQSRGTDKWGIVTRLIVK